MTRRFELGLVVLVVVAAGFVWAANSGGDAATEAAPRIADTATAEVATRDLVVTDSYDGTLGFGDARAYTSERSGIVTTTAAATTTVRPGDTLFSVDFEPTVVLTGAVPAYRALDRDSTDGPDIVELEQALVSLGFGAELTVDAAYDRDTENAVEAWETALGRAEPDGVVAFGDVVFTAGAVRVATIEVEVGGRVQAGSTVLTATATTQVVSVDLDADRSDEFQPGTTVELTLPDGSESTGTVAEVGTETEAADATNPGGAPTVAVTITLDDPDAAAAFDSGGVDIAIERSREDRATAVPVTALVALVEGGYALEVVDDTVAAGTRLVAVDPGTYAEGWVGVSGDGVVPGLVVLVPE